MFYLEWKHPVTGEWFPATVTGIPNRAIALAARDNYLGAFPQLKLRIRHSLRVSPLQRRRGELPAANPVY